MSQLRTNVLLAALGILSGTAQLVATRWGLDHFIGGVRLEDLIEQDFAWQEGYGAFSVSASNLDSVVKYVREQNEYHRSRTFQEEFRSFLVKHGIRTTSAVINLTD